MKAGEKAERALSTLRLLLTRHATRDVVAAFLNLCMRRANDLEYQGDLMSPARQGDVLLTQLLSTPEPVAPAPYGPNEWTKTADLLNEAFGAYQELFWPDAAELDNLSDEWKRVREVAMPAFLHYFNTGLIANPEQVRARINSYLVPFDNVFIEAGLISATDTLRVADWVGNRLELALSDLSAVMDELSEARDLTTKHTLDIESARQFAQKRFRGLGDRVMRTLDDFGTVSKAELVAEFGQLGESYWSEYSIGRGEAKPLTYPTEVASASIHPLIRLSDQRAMVPSINSLWTALLDVGEELLTRPAARDRYFIHRDRTLEAEVATQFRRLTSHDAQVHAPEARTRRRRSQSGHGTCPP